MIPNARMYSVTPQVAALWRSLLGGVLSETGSPVEVVDHAPPAPISELWSGPTRRRYSCAACPTAWHAAPEPVVAPIPSPRATAAAPATGPTSSCGADSPFETIEQTFGHRLALTTPESQSGYAALLHALMPSARSTPLYHEIIEPRFTPMGALTAVIERKAEVAPLDSYAFALLSKHAPDLTAQVRVIMHTEPTPAPLLVASGPVPPAVSSAFLAASEKPSPSR